MNALETLKSGLGTITEVLLLLIGIGIVLQILFGPDVAFITFDVVNNLVGVIRGVGESGVYGLVALAIIVWIFHRRTVGRREPPPVAEGELPEPPAPAEGESNA